MTIRTIVFRGLKFAGSGITVVLLATILVNAFDRPLDSGAQALLDRPLPTVADEQNLFHALIGFSTLSADPAENEDFSRIGTRMRAAALKAMAAGESPISFPKADGDAAIELVGDADALCGSSKPSPHHCLAKVAANRAALAGMLAENHELLRRYHALSHYPRYVNDMPASALVPPTGWFVVLTAQKLAHAEIGLQFADQDPTDALENLAQDAAFWRGMLTVDHGFLLEKMLAAAAYRRTLALAGEVLRSQSLTPTQYQALARVLKPLSAQERSLTAALENEMAYVKWGLSLIGPAATDARLDQSGFAERIGYRISRYFFQPNASLNRAYRGLRAAIATADLPCSEARAAKVASDQAFRLGWAGYFYNPVGNALSSITSGTYRDYAPRMCDLDGLSRIVGLELLVRWRGITTSATAAFVAAAGSRYTNPYTDQPMSFYPGIGLAFKASDPRTGLLLPWPI